MEEINENDFDELIEIINEEYDKKINQNIESHNNNFKKSLKKFDEIKTLYFLLSYVVTNDKESEELKGRHFFCEKYLRVVADNCYELKQLFEKGLHIQFQLLFRSQFEFLNTLIAFVGSEDYFKIYCRENDKNFILTPKPINTEKALKKILKNHIKGDFDAFWSTFNLILKSIYSQLSTNSHGNIPSIALQSYQGRKDNTEIFDENFCGVEYPLNVTKEIVKQFFHYSQIAGSILVKLLDENDMLDKNHLFYNYIYLRSNKFEIITIE
ncbi:hypothetical protein [Riemerella anatipestifer]|uniref:hypothetical protein n=1 Tax=Riemerella anatipestifer TaxID=34085 RepID=UPI001374D7B9|nr:hypothetical protein [Riemerella anatipestifer]